MACAEGVGAGPQRGGPLRLHVRSGGAGADYGLGRILAEAYPDPTKLQEIWKLYTDSLASGGSLLNLTPVKPGASEDPSLQKKSEDPALQRSRDFSPACSGWDSQNFRFTPT